MKTLKNICMIMIGGIAMLSFLFFLGHYLQKNEVFIESIESKTADGKKIYNKIRFIAGEDKDVWLMDQNHPALKEGWDHLKIEVDKTTKPYKAYYYQMDKKGKEVEYRVSCYMCHVNGPRAIRANFASKKTKNNFWDMLTVFYWNLTIKHYGTIETPERNLLHGVVRKVPVKIQHPRYNKVVEPNSCSLCHGKESLMGRSELKSQHRATIMHLVNEGQMPPWPFKLDQSDRVKLNNMF